MAFNVTNPINTGGISTLPGADNRDIGLVKFDNEVISYYNEKTVALNLVRKATIMGGKSKQFIVSGQGGDALTHTPGTDITSNIMDLDEVILVVNDRSYKSFYLDELDEKLSQWDSRFEMVKQSVATINLKIDKELFALVETAISTAPKADQDAGSIVTMNGYLALTDEEARGQMVMKSIFKLKAEFIKKRVPTDELVFVTNVDTYFDLVLAKDPINKDFNETGNGGIDKGEIFKIAGIKIIHSNNLPATANLQGLMFTPDAVGYLEAIGVKSTLERDPRSLGNLLVSQVAYGTGVLNPACAGALIGAV